MGTRIWQIDFIKGILIFLMVMFHLRYIGVYHDLYANITHWVYLFHMPGFFLISGLFAKYEKPLTSIVHYLKVLVLVYLFFESIYVLMIYLASQHGFTSNSVELNGFDDFFYYLFINPIGVYWYLHTLLICQIIYIGCFKIKTNKILRFILLFICLYSLSIIGLTNFDNSVFFLLGVFINQFKLNILNLKISIFLLLSIFIILTFISSSFDRGDLADIILVLDIVLLCIKICEYCGEHHIYSKIISHLGKNSLPIMLFSPCFTFITPIYSKILQFDSSGFIFSIISTILIIILSLLSAKLWDFVDSNNRLLGKKMYLR